MDKISRQDEKKIISSWGWLCVCVSVCWAGEIVLVMSNPLLIDLIFIEDFTFHFLHIANQNSIVCVFSFIGVFFSLVLLRFAVTESSLVGLKLSEYISSPAPFNMPLC